MSDKAPAIRELRALYRVSQAVHASLDLREVVRRVLSILAEELGMQRGTLALVDSATGELAIEVAHGLSEAEMRRGRYRVGEGIMGRVLESGEPMAIPNIGEEPLFLDRTGARRELDRSQVAFLCVPLRWQEETVGVMSADQLGGSRRDLQEDLRLLTIVAGVVSQAVGIQRMVLRETSRLREENRTLRHLLDEALGSHPVLGNSPPMLAVLDQIELLAHSSTPALITGEEGTGRRTVALCIHRRSDRAELPFVRVPCAGAASDILEEHLFGGEEAGAGTGAAKGALERARAGTLFFDEVADLPLSMQARVANALREHQYRTGDGRLISLHARPMACTARDLAREVRAGRFREDLYHRLNVVPVHLPPLRDRRSDVPLLAGRFLQERAKGTGRSPPRWSPAAVELLVRYPWPGNVRELREVVDQAARGGEAEELGPERLPGRIRGGHYPSLSPDAALERLGEATAEACASLLRKPESGGIQAAVWERVEQTLLHCVLRHCGGTRLEAARLLGINRNTLYRKLERYGEP